MAMAEEVIRRRVEDWSRERNERNLQSVMALYAPDLVSFDLEPRPRRESFEKKRLAWQEFFAVHTGINAYEVRELDVTTEGDVAFVRSRNRVSGTSAKGDASDLWVRWTACFRRINGVWLVVHDHVSVPARLRAGTAALDLTP
jgi:ketosteroid isomerase-like protein